MCMLIWCWKMLLNSKSVGVNNAVAQFDFDGLDRNYWIWLLVECAF